MVASSLLPTHHQLNFIWQNFRPIVGQSSRGGLTEAIRILRLINSFTVK